MTKLSFNKRLKSLEAKLVSNKQLVLVKIKQAQQLLLDVKSIENSILECKKPVPISVKNFFIITFLTIVVFSLFGPDNGGMVLIGVILIATLIHLRSKSKKLTERKLEDNKELINELSKRKKELNHSLDTLDIGPIYLDLEILNKFEFYIKNNLAETLKECVEEYNRECEREKLMAKLDEIQNKQDELLEEIISNKVNNELSEPEDLKRRMKIE